MYRSGWCQGDREEPDHDGPSAHAKAFGLYPVVRRSVCSFPGWFQSPPSLLMLTKSWIMTAATSSRNPRFLGMRGARIQSKGTRLTLGIQWQDSFRPEIVFMVQGESCTLDQSQWGLSGPQPSTQCRLGPSFVRTSQTNQDTETDAEPSQLGHTLWIQKWTTDHGSHRGLGDSFQSSPPLGAKASW